MLPVRCKSVKVTTSGVVTVATKAGICCGLVLIGGTSDSKVILKDGGTSGTDTLAITTNAGTNVGDEMASVMPTVPVWFSTDIWATLSGTNAYCYVLYAQMER